MTYYKTETFPFGDIAMSSVSSPDLENRLVLQQVAYTPTLPAGKSVDVFAAYCVAFTTPYPVHDFSFDFTLTECLLEGDPSSGKYLDAQSWSLGEGLLMLGTEDGDALQARMPWLKNTIADYPVEYLRNGFRISIPHIAPHTNVSFHFVLAYNHVDTGSDSEWFAVDFPHSKLLQLPVLKHIYGASVG